MNIWIASDWHLWSEPISNRHPFRSVDNIGRLNAQYIENIKPDDIFIHLGDLCDPENRNSNKLKAVISTIPGYKILCKGNHDILDDDYYLDCGFDVVCDVCIMHDIAFSHKPINIPPDMINVHGHLHTRKMSTLGYQHINAYVSSYDTHPVLLDDLFKNAIVQTPDDWTGTRLDHVKEAFEKYTSIENDVYTNIVTIDDKVSLAPLDESTGSYSQTLNEILFQDIDQVKYWLSNDTDYEEDSISAELNETVTFHDVSRIVDKIPKKEHHYFYHGSHFKNSPYIKYRDVAYVTNGRGKTTGAFIEIYAFDDNLDTGIVVIAAEPEARGKGLTDKLLQNAIKNVSKQGITKLLAHVDKDNPHSYQLLIRNGFEDISDINQDQYKLIINIEPTNKSSSVPINEVSTKPISFVDIIEFNKDLNSYEYADNDFSNYKIRTIQKFEKDQGGVCWDYVVIQHEWFKDRSLDHQTYYIVFNVAPYYPTHTFQILPYGPGFIHFESSYKRIAGLWYSDSKNDLINHVADTMMYQEPNLRGKQFEVRIYDPSKAIGKKPVDFMEWMDTQQKIPVKFNNKYNVKLINSPDEPLTEAVDLQYMNIQYKTTLPKWITSDILDTYKDKADAIVMKTESEQRRVPPPRRAFKPKAGIITSYDTTFQVRFLNPKSKSSVVKTDRDLLQNQYFIHNETKYELLFILDKTNICTVYITDGLSHICKKLGSFRADVNKLSRIQSMLSEDSASDDSDAVYLDGPNVEHHILFGDQVPFFSNERDLLEENSILDENMLSYGIQDLAFAAKGAKDNVSYTGSYDKLRPRLIKMVDSTKSIDRLIYLRKDAYLGIKQLDTLIANMEAVKKGTPSRYVHVKDIEKRLRMGNSPHKVRSHQKWLRDTYIPHINDCIKEIKIKLNEAANTYQFSMEDKSLHFIDKINETSENDGKLYPVYIILMHSGTALSSAIKKVTNSQFSHASISFDSSMHSMYSFGRKADVNPFIGGFKKEDIRNEFFQSREIPYALYMVPCTQSEISQMKKRLDYFIKNSTKFKYDFTGLFKNYFGIADNPEYKWFCSRFVADILNAGRPSHDPYVIEPSLIKPEDFKFTNFAQYVTGGMLATYNKTAVDKLSNMIIRAEKLRRMKEHKLAESVGDYFGIDLQNPYQENVLGYQLAMMDESAFDDFVKYLNSFKIRFDKDGNIILTRREYDKLDQHFKHSVKMLRAYQKADNRQGIKDELCRIYYMIELINQHYLDVRIKANPRIKSDIRKQMLDLRSVMLNVFQQNLIWITQREPNFRFQKYYDNSDYGKKLVVPKEVLTTVGKTIVTSL